MTETAITKNNKRPGRFLLQMRDDLRDGLQKSADTNGRTLTAEINSRLRASLASSANATLDTRISAAKAYTYASTTGQLPPSYSEGPTPPLTANDNGPAPALSDLDRAMLVVFHTLPPQKQLALLSLFQ